MDVEKKLQAVDFSKASRVKDSLLAKLLTKHKEIYTDGELSMDELDFVTAAGPGYQTDYPGNKNNKVR